MTDFVEEVWKDVVGFDGLYKVSNRGNIINSREEPLKQNTKNQR